MFGFWSRVLVLMVGVLGVACLGGGTSQTGGETGTGGSGPDGGGPDGGGPDGGGPGTSPEAGSSAPATLAWFRELAATPHPGTGPQSSEVYYPSLAVGADGSVYVSAGVHGDLTIDGKTFESAVAAAGFGQGLLAKFNPDGTLAWGVQTMTYGGGQAMTVLPGGDVVVASTLSVSNDFSFFTSTPPDSNSFDDIVCIARLDSNGNKKWSACGTGLLPSYNKCVLRAGYLEVDGDVVTLAGLAYDGRCELPGGGMLDVTTAPAGAHFRRVRRDPGSAVNWPVSSPAR